MRARCAAAGLLAVIAIELSTPALAQTLPSQIIVVVPYAAGGSTDAGVGIGPHPQPPDCGQG